MSQSTRSPRFPRPDVNMEKSGSMRCLHARASLQSFCTCARTLHLSSRLREGSARDQGYPSSAPFCWNRHGNTGSTFPARRLEQDMLIRRRHNESAITSLASHTQHDLQKMEGAERKLLREAFTAELVVCDSGFGHTSGWNDKKLFADKSTEADLNEIPGPLKSEHTTVTGMKGIWGPFDL